MAADVLARREQPALRVEKAGRVQTSGAREDRLLLAQARGQRVEQLRVDAQCRLDPRRALGQHAPDHGSAADAAGRTHHGRTLQALGAREGRLRERRDERVSAQLGLDARVGRPLEREEVLALLEHALGEEQAGCEILVVPWRAHRGHEARDRGILRGTDAQLERLLDGQRVLALDVLAVLARMQTHSLDRIHTRIVAWRP